MNTILETYRTACAELSKPYYTDIPYHNFRHAQQVENYAVRLAQTLGLDHTQLLGVSNGAWTHDANYHLAPTPGFATKEDVSIDISSQVARVLAQQFALDDHTLATIQALATDGIEATKIPCEDFSTEPRKIMRAADVQHLGTPDVDQFMRDTALIYHEYSLLNEGMLREKGRWPLPIDLFQEKQAEILELLLQKMIGKIPEAPYFPIGFYANYARNIEHLKVIDFKKYI